MRGQHLDAKADVRSAKRRQRGKALTVVTMKKTCLCATKNGK
jgi:hypothetical protein